VRIDNSRAKAWHACPAFYQERYRNNLERKGGATGTDFGTRFHQLLEGHYKQLAGIDTTHFSASADRAIEDEAQTTFAAYLAQYPVEPFEVVAVEQFFDVPLPRICWQCGGRVEGDRAWCCDNQPGKHTYCGEFDAIVRDKETGLLQLFETKTEKRGGKANLPQAWASRAQVGLYLWAAQTLYGEPFKNIILNVVTRQSPAGKFEATFRRDELERTAGQLEQAVENLVWTADQIEEMEHSFGSELWPQDREKCVTWGWPCDYYSLHVGEKRPDEQLIQIEFQPAKEYLAL
jgi:hypothetical protein